MISRADRDGQKAGEIAHIFGVAGARSRKHANLADQSI
jgi:hypothetical protein